MPINTNAARAAYQNHQITRSGAEKVEEIASAAVELGEAREKLGIGGDVWDTVSSSPAYRALEPVERSVLASVYGEMMGHASTGLGNVGGVGGAVPTRAELVGAYHEINNVLERMNALARAHGPGVVVPNPSAPGFNLNDYPQLILEHAHRIRGEIAGPEPYILVTFDTRDLDNQRTRYNVARDDVTPQSVHDAIRRVLDGAFDNVEIRVQSEQDLAAGRPPERISNAAAPPQQQTFAQRVQGAAELVLSNIDQIPELAGRIQSVEAGMAEMVPIINVRSSLAEGPAFRQLKDEMMGAIADFLKNNGFADVIDDNYLGNSIQLVSRDGGFGV